MNVDTHKTVLLVEDEHFVAMTEKAVLEKHGYNVITVSDGEIAIETMRSTPGINLVLMDIDLGKGIDGTAAAAAILENHEIPLIFLSSHITHEVIEKTEKITSYGYIAKNSSETILAASIKMAFKLFEARMREKKNSEALMKSERRYRAIFDNSAEGIFQTTLEGRYKIVNPAFAHMLGYGSPAELIDAVTDIGKLYANPDDRHRIIRLMTEFNGAIRGIEVQMIRKDGSRFWISINARIMQDIEGEPPFIEGTCIDITGRKRIEDALNETQDKFKEIFDNSLDNIFVIDVTADRRFIIKTINNAEEKAIAMSKSEIEGRFIDELFPPKIAAPVIEKYNHCIDIRKNYCYDETVEMFGEKTHYSTSLVPLFDKNGVIFRIVGVSRNVTERKLAEEKIKTLLHEKEIILKEVHHRIKNNMNTIVGMLTLQAIKPHNLAARPVLQDAITKVKSMMVLYDKLYRASSGVSVPLREYLPAFVCEVAGIFMETISLKTSVESDDITLDANILSPLGIIINELVTNAVKYAFNGRKEGAITVTASKKENNRVLLTFKDDGSGIPESVSFENSSGFGLKLIKLLTDQINGSVTIERNGGTAFFIEFNA